MAYHTNEGRCMAAVWVPPNIVHVELYPGLVMLFCHAVCHALLCLVLPVYCDCDTVTIVDSSDSSMLLCSQAGNSIYIDWLWHLHILWILWPHTPNCDLIFDSYKIYPPSISFKFLQSFILFCIISPCLPHFILSHPKHKHYWSDKKFMVFCSRLNHLCPRSW